MRNVDLARPGAQRRFLSLASLAVVLFGWEVAGARPGAQRRFLCLAALAAALGSWPEATCGGDPD